MVKESFDCFTVYSEDDSYSFMHIDIKDKPEFYNKLFEYFFSEDKLLRYCENKVGITFKPTKVNYTILCKHLKTYLDDAPEFIDITHLDSLLINILEKEGIVDDEDGKKIARKDKIGKIGEYIFCCILADYFQFDCVIPKVHLQTDYNMNVYGIDVIFYSSDNNMLLFGESKFCVNLDNGISLIKKSLSEYENQLKTEYEIVLSNRFYKEKLNIFNNLYGDTVEKCIDIEEFIKEARIDKIGIPVFIAHGTQLDPITILKKLNKIPTNNFFGIETYYYSISLPTIDKYKLIAAFTKCLRDREAAYARARTL